MSKNLSQVSVTSNKQGKNSRVDINGCDAAFLVRFKADLISRDAKYSGDESGL